MCQVTMLNCAMLLLCFSFVMLWSSSGAFNVETDNYVMQTGDPKSMFGFSVALHKEGQYSWAIVGAPEADTKRRLGLNATGAVYRCPVDRNVSQCEEINFDKEGNTVSQSYRVPIDEKSYQWFGATVSSAGVDGPLVACAPRYTFFSTNPTKVTRRDPVGTCFIAKNYFRQFEEYSPCRTLHWGYHRQGSCQAGLGAAMSKDGKRVYIGAPGSWYWHGQLYSVATDIRVPFMPPSKYESFGESILTDRGQLYSQSLNSRSNVAQTTAGPVWEDDSYLGYSVAVGDFVGNGTQGAAVGMPRGDQLFGKVLLYTSEMYNLQNITGNQLGAYFGYAICVADVDGDGRDDIIIGSPMYTDYKNNKDEYETGRVHIFYQKNYYDAPWHVRDGTASKSRFGLALTSLGDMNQDKYDDFAVGAPYEGKDGKAGPGAVYIYHGSANGVRETYSQVIYAEHFGPLVNTFGFSLSGGVDFDGNGYPDMMIGAYDSNNVMVLKARPVVSLMAKITFIDLKSKLISLDQKDCKLRDGSYVSCTKISTCLKYIGKNVDDSLVFTVTYTLDSMKTTSPRLFFLFKENENTHSENVTLYRDGAFHCKEYDVYIKNDLKDKLSPLVAEMNYTFIETHNRRTKRSLTAVLDSNIGLVKKDTINIQKNCGEDDVCIPNLKLNVTSSVTHYLLHSGHQLKLQVDVKNRGEDSFETKFITVLPADVDFDQFKPLEGAEDILIECNSPNKHNNTLICLIGNPLPMKKTISFEIYLTPKKEHFGKKPTYDFEMFVNSSNPGIMTANSQNMTIKIWVQTNLTITSISTKNELFYNASQYSANALTIKDLGPQFEHVYEITNDGTSTIEEAEITLVWPYQTLDGDELVYMVEQPETSGNIYCASSQFVNNRQLTAEKLTSVLVAHNIEVVSSADVQDIKVQKNIHGVSTTVFVATKLTDAEIAEQEKHKFSTGDSSDIVKTRKEEAEKTTAAGGGSQSSYNKTTTSTNESGGTTTHYYSNSSSSSSSSHTSGGASGSSGSSTTYVEESGGGSGPSTHWQQGGGSGGSSGGASGHSEQYGGSQTSGGSASGHSEQYGGSETSSGSASGHAGQYGGSSGGGSTGGVTSYHNLTTVGHGGPSTDIYSTRSRSFTIDSNGEILYNISINGRLEQRRAPYTEYMHILREELETQNKELIENSLKETDFQLNEQLIQQTQDILRRTAAADRERVSEELRRRNEEVFYRAREENRHKLEKQLSEVNYKILVDFQHEYDRFYKVLLEKSEEERRRSEEERRRIQEEHRRIAEERQRSEEARRRSDEERRRVEQERRRYEIRQGQAESTEGTVNPALTTQLGGKYSSAQNRTHYIDLNHGQQGGWDANYGEGYHGGNYNQNVDHRSGSGNRRGNVDTREYSNEGGGLTGLEKAATGTGGFHVGYFDVDPSGGSSGSSGSSTHSRQGGGYDANNRQDLVHGYGNGGGSGSRYESSSSYSHSTGPHESHSEQTSYHRSQQTPTEPKLTHYGRVRRQAAEDQELQEAINCRATKCAILKCIVGPLPNGQHAHLGFRAVVNAQTLKKVSFNSELKVSSRLVGRVTKLQFIDQQQPLKSAEIITTIKPDPLARPDVVPLWVVVLSACAGIIILLLLIFLLYKCGFFKRNRPSDAPERQPLNRNGY